MAEQDPAELLVEVRDLHVHYKARRQGGRAQVVRAVDGVDLDIYRGETLALVGESGCGKSSLGRAVLQLSPIAQGSVSLAGEVITQSTRSRLRALRTEMQIVFQDPYASLNPFKSVFETLSEPLVVHKIGDTTSRREIVLATLAGVGLDEGYGRRYPHELSGGQRQRVALGRALILQPAFVVCDEPVSALDVSIQAQILKLLADQQQERGLTYLFISHDLAVVENFADRVAVMYLGKIIEMGSIADVFDQPGHPYTVALMSAAPRPDPAIERSRQRIVLAGDLPSPINPPSGCRFRTRCWLYKELGEPNICRESEPRLNQLDSSHVSACHFSSDPSLNRASANVPGTFTLND